jgi:uncharacterized protein (TIGR04255 family)
MKTAAAKMSLVPVFYALAQVQFNPIAQISVYVDQLQERLRRSGFPDFRAEKFELTIRRLEESNPDVQPQQHTRWSFTNTERTEGYLLLSNALVFHTTAYNTFDDFLKKTLIGMALVHEIVELAYVDRIGLRYLDAVLPVDGNTLSHYLNPSLLGFSASLDGKLGHSFTETVTAIADGSLVARAVITDGSLALSPDLSPLQLELHPRFMAVNGRNAMLDTDYSVIKRGRFDLEKIKAQLLASHEIIANAFTVAVTDHAPIHVEPSIDKKVDLRSPAEHIANIRDVLDINMSDLASLLWVTRPTVYAWLAGQEPKGDAVIRIQHLSRLTDKIHRANIIRLDKLIHRPVLNGRSLLDILKTEEDPSSALVTLKLIADREAEARLAPKGSGKHLRSLDDVLSESSVAIHEGS